MRNTIRVTGLAALAATLLTGSACTVKKQAAPELTGPSELGLSLTITASPDVLEMNGGAQSSITVTARNPQGQPVRDVPLRAEIIYAGQVSDVGQLNTKTAFTNGEGRAGFVYTAPLSPQQNNADPGNRTVTLRVIPVGTDYANATGRTVTIRLVPQGVILPRPNTPVARFVMSPAAPAQGVAVQFDGSASVDVIECPANAASVDACTTTKSTLVDYAWNFGDGSTASGQRVSHTYDRVGTYTVTLTVTNTRGITASASQFVTVGASADPTAAFTTSPSTPIVGQAVFFNASGSKATAGRSIVAYDWTFGDGSEASGVNVSHRYTRNGSFVVTLTVRDDIGREGTASQTITVGVATVPTASFSISPSAALANQDVVVDASASTPQPGATIVSYRWAFGDTGDSFSCPGDARCGSGNQTFTYRYTRTGQFTITLSVTDSTGRTGTVSRTVDVK